MACRIIDIVSSVILSVLLANSEGCPDGWTGHQSSCYIYIKELYNWFDAKSTCEAMGGNLVEIQTPTENHFLTGLVHEHGDLHPWIGLEDFEKEGQFVWVTTRERPEQTFWGSGEPSDTHGHEDCGGIVGSSGLWFDGACDTDLRPFVCETQSCDRLCADPNLNPECLIIKNGKCICLF